MQISVNGKLRDVTGSVTIRAVLNELGFGDRLVAVELNREIVPRAEHGERVVAPGDSLEIVHFVGGG